METKKCTPIQVPFLLDHFVCSPYPYPDYDAKLGINSQFVYQYELNGKTFLTNNCSAIGMRHFLLIAFASALLAGGCATPNPPNSSFPTEPSERRARLAQSIPADAAPGSIYEIKVYIVRPGDTLEKVLDRFHLTEQELRDLNPPSPRIPPHYFKHLLVKQRLVVYERIEQ